MGSELDNVTEFEEVGDSAKRCAVPKPRFYEI